ncbi:Short-chain dehydrogenase reductase SDR [Cordyceps militaris]|uniref:Short-chain dehydrogenase reductase SDR n=1 Tax=Cordyceps militaris TaxID=73501 RepID=A0A2H4S6S1_CORMI|nr:Short-chain dehydrogenase reductase SDR [Cordyceps militaris]
MSKNLITGLLRGKTACITGGTTGIGRAITLEYLRQGANVAVNHLDLPQDAELKKSLIQAAADLKRHASPAQPIGELLEQAGDITDPATGEALVGAAVSAWGKLDILVSNAGIFQPAEFLSQVLDKTLFDRTMAVNVHGAFYTLQAAARQMVRQGHGGALIGVSSISALQGGRLQTHYTPGKAAVASMVQSVAVALAPHGIRCNALLPGTVRTQLAEADMRDPKKRAFLEDKIPLGVGRPEDVAGPAVFLACERLSAWVTGAQILVDGGMYAHLQ